MVDTGIGKVGLCSRNRHCEGDNLPHVTTSDILICRIAIQSFMVVCFEIIVSARIVFNMV